LDNCAAAHSLGWLVCHHLAHDRNAVDGVGACGSTFQSHISLVFFFGWWTIKKKRWAIYSGFLLSFGKTLAFANASFGKPINFYNLTKVFEDVPAYSFVDRFLFLICIMLQTFLYGCAIAAQRKHKVCD